MSVLHRVLLCMLCVPAFLLESCQTTTPHMRIEQNPLMFRSLSPEYQLMVQQGRICEGMGKDAVYLAWGNPNTPPVCGQQDGQSYEKWVYSVYQPVAVDSVSVGGGGWHHGHWCGGGLTSSTVMVPREAAWVMFRDGVVTSWESSR